MSQFALSLCTEFTNKNNTPCHIFIIYVFGQLAYYIDFSVNSIIFLVYILFILFLSLIFNEIIEINFCGLSDNTKRNIILRAEKEILMLGKNERESKVILSDENFYIELI